MGLGQLQVCGDPVTRFQQHHIPSDQVSGVHHRAAAIAADRRIGGDELTQPLTRLVGTVFLGEGEAAVEEHDQGDGGGQLRHPGQQR